VTDPKVSRIHDTADDPFRHVARWIWVHRSVSWVPAQRGDHYYRWPCRHALPAGIRQESATWLLWSWDPVAVAFKP